MVILFGCDGRNIHRNFVLLDKCHDSHLLWCEVQNDQPGSPVEDNINLYRSDLCRVMCCWINSIQSRQSVSGSGIMVDAGCLRCIVASNVVLNTRNCGIGLAGGVANTVVGNFVQQTGKCAGGIYCSKQYRGERFEKNALIRNQSYWVRANGQRNPFWWEGVVDVQFDRAGNVSLAEAKDVTGTYQKSLAARKAIVANPPPDTAQSLHT